MLSLSSPHENSTLVASPLENVMRGCQLSPGIVSTLASGVTSLDALLKGGLRYGEVTEWGIPWGRGGRALLVRFLAALPPDQWGLWVHSRPDVMVNPPAFAAYGVSLERVRFCQTSQPLTDLKAIFMQDFFRLIVLDLQTPLSSDECAFLSQRAKANRQIIILVRHFFLASERGNVWAKRRVNCWQDEKSGLIVTRGIKGMDPQVHNHSFRPR